MSGTVSYTNFDFDAVAVVPVIASFDSEGRMRPFMSVYWETRIKLTVFGKDRDMQMLQNLIAGS